MDHPHTHRSDSALLHAMQNIDLGLDRTTVDFSAVLADLQTTVSHLQSAVTTLQHTIATLASSPLVRP